MKGEDVLMVSQTIGSNNDSVTFTFPLGFSIQATARGVSFAGSSPNFGEPQMQRILKFIKWANRISTQLREGRGMMPEQEYKRKLVLRTRRAADHWLAWYEGHFSQRQEGRNEADAVKALRSLYRTLHAAD